METALLIALCLVGMIGTLIPVLPGSGLIFVGILAYALLTNFQIITVSAVMTLLGLMLVGTIGQFFITSLGAKVMGAGKYGIIGALVGFCLGLFLIPLPGGSLLGAFAGAFLCELAFTLKSQQESLKAGIGAVIGAILSLFFEFFIGLIMIIYTLTLIWNSAPTRGIIL
ncbi:MAG: DUF456 domain-containing protein [Deltaproteobacteria bacterium]|nr:DUF456 domain-containing protein [Deltaproteobacteria bacterium]